MRSQFSEFVQPRGLRALSEVHGEDDRQSEQTAVRFLLSARASARRWMTLRRRSNEVLDTGVAHVDCILQVWPEHRAPQRGQVSWLSSSAARFACWMMRTLHVS